MQPRSEKVHQLFEVAIKTGQDGNMPTKKQAKTGKKSRTFSSSSFRKISSSARFFSSSSWALVFFPLPPVTAVFFLASRASFSFCLISLMRGSRLMCGHECKAEKKGKENLPKRKINKPTQLRRILLLSPSSLRFVLLFCVSLIVTAVPATCE